MADITTNLPSLSLTDRLRAQQQAGQLGPVAPVFVPSALPPRVSIGGYDPFATAVRPGIPAGGAISSVPAIPSTAAANAIVPPVTPTQLPKLAATPAPNATATPNSSTVAPSGLDYRKLSVAQFAALKQADPGTFGPAGASPTQAASGATSRLPTLQGTPAAPADNSPGQVWDPYSGSAFRPGVDTLPTVMSGQGLLTADPVTHATTQLSNVLTRQEIANSYAQNGGRVDPGTLSLLDQNGASKELLAAITSTGNSNTAAYAHIAGSEIGASATLGAAGIGANASRDVEAVRSQTQKDLEQNKTQPIGTLPNPENAFGPVLTNYGLVRPPTTEGGSPTVVPVSKTPVGSKPTLEAFQKANPNKSAKEVADKYKSLYGQ